MAWLAIATEVGCSALLILGLGTRFAAAALAFTMVIAAFVVHQADPWQKKELAVIYLLIYVTLLVTGAGQFSADHCWLRNKSADSTKPADSSPSA